MFHKRLPAKTVKLIIPAGLLLLFISSCDSSRIYEKNLHIKGHSWNRNDRKVFEVNITDTTSLNNVYINIRNTTDYKFSNLFLFLGTTYPNGQISRDTIEIILAAPDGKWLGKGMGKIKEEQILFKRGVYFPIKGMYKFSFQQAMRVENLEGIEDIGIRIENVLK